MDCLNTGYKVQSNIAGMSLVADSSNQNISDSQRNKHRELDHSKEEMASDQKTFVPKILHHDGNTCAPGFMSNIGSATKSFNRISPRTQEENQDGINL